MAGRLVLGLGAATWDDLWCIPAFPSTEGVTEAFQSGSAGGGPVATALCVLSRLGHETRLIDVLGDDHTASQIISELHSHGVGTDSCQRISGKRSSRAFILVRKEDGARHITFQRSTAGEPQLSTELDALLPQAKWLHLNGRHLRFAEAYVKKALQHEITLSFDGGAGRYHPGLRTLYSHCQVRLFSKDFAECSLGKRANVEELLPALWEDGMRVQVITDGERGSWYYTPEEGVCHQPAFTAQPLMDTTGCGDTYQGMFLHGLLENWPHAQCAHEASRFAALTAQGLGGRHALATLEKSYFDKSGQVGTHA